MKIAARVEALEAAHKAAQPPERIAVALPLGPAAFLPDETEADYLIRRGFPPGTRIMRVALIDGRRLKREPMPMHLRSV
ncbi:MAG: hypothetical protein CVV12_08800 [Gammaproteobacteria bacterium HGW-Gammaproteobacteria-2]|jgi:hypothetical protein|nr:MAG: hypothetical protein CVV12_08800 [Gammaproteobacteria bacterium HGW-Gammaproteobacteria-2]